MFVNVYVISSLAAFLGALVLAAFVINKGQSSPQKKAFIPIAVLAGTWCLFPAISTLSDNKSIETFLVRIIYLAGVFTGPAFMEFGLTLARRQNIAVEKKLIKGAYLVALLWTPVLFTDLFISGVNKYRPFFSLRVGFLYPIFIMFFLTTCVYSFYRIFEKYIQSTGHLKNQLKYIFLAYLIAFVSALIHFGSAYGLEERVPHDILVFLCMAILGYAIFRYQLLDIRIAITRFAVFVLVYSVVLGIPFGLAILWQDRLILLFGQSWFWIPMLSLLVLSTVGPFIYFIIQKKAEEHLLKEDLRVQNFLIQSSYGMRAIHDLKKLLQFIRGTMTRTLDLDRVEIFMLDKAGMYYETAGRRADPVRFSSDDPAVAFVKTQTAPMLYDEMKMRHESHQGRPADQGIYRMMSALKFQAVVPILMGGGLAGFVGLGHRRANEPFSQGMLNALSVFGNQAALAIENCRYIEAESRRMQEEGFQERIASLDMMASSFAHEIDNPMGIINGQVDCLGMALDDPRVVMPSEVRESVKESFQHIIGASQRVSGMVKAILEYSRMGTGELKPVAMADVCESFWHLMGPQIKAEKIECVMDVADGLPFVLGDKVQLEEILMNFASNSIHALRVRERRRIRLAIFQKDDKTIRLEFEDNGYGIPGHLLKDVFLASVTTKGSSEGTGLGLFRVRKIADLHQAQVWAQPRESEEGTMMVFEIPVFEGDIQTAIDEHHGKGLEGSRALF